MAKRIALTTGARYNYSPIEQKMFSLLSEQEKITSTHLAKECFGKQELYARNNAVTRMRLLSEKVKLNKEPFRIASGSTQRGPRPKEYWIERV